MLKEEQVNELYNIIKNNYLKSMVKVLSRENLIDKVITTKNVNIQDKSGNTLLMYAILLENIELIKLLIKFGANTLIKNNKGQTALDWAKNKDEILEHINDSSKKSQKSKNIDEVRLELKKLLK